MAAKRHKAGSGNGSKRHKVDAVASFGVLRRRLLDAGLDDVIDLEILKACLQPPERRRIPPPGSSVVYDRHYADLRMRGFIAIKPTVPGAWSFSDYYVLTDAGKRLLSGKAEP